MHLPSDKTIFLLACTILFLLFISTYWIKDRIPIFSRQKAKITLVELQKESYHPQIPSLEQIFSEDHSWIATLSAEHKRILITTGDVIPARSVNYQIISRNNINWPYESTAEILKQADITLINLETPFVDNCPLTNEGMIFCGDVRNVNGLLFAGVDIANFANNHMGNYGIKGVNQTKELLENAGILTSGIDGPRYLNVRGIRFAFLGYNDVDLSQKLASGIQNEKISQEIQATKNNANIIVLSFHWGSEYTHTPTQRQRELAHLAIDAGADLIVGNHPHWIQPVEIYNHKIITYAHGNFVFDQMWSEKTREGIIGRYTFYDATLVDVEFMPIYVKDYGQPFVLEDERGKNVLNFMKEISRNN